MTDQKVLTARAWGSILAWATLRTTAIQEQSDILGFVTTVVITHIPGLTHDQMESDILAGLSLLAKSREVCEHRWKYKSILNGDNYLTACGVIYPESLKLERPCWCGRKVEVKE